MDTDLEKYLEPNWQEAKAESGDQVDETVEAQATEEKSGEVKETDLEKQLNSFEEKPEGETKSDLLALVNKLGLSRNDVPIELKDEKELKEYISKGFDYTQKTQEHAENVKKEREALDTEYQTKLKEIQEYESKVKDDVLSTNILFKVLKKLDKENPDLVADIEEMYNSEMEGYKNSINNPVVNDLQKKLEELSKKIEGKDGESIQKQNEGIVKEWETGLETVQKEWGAKLKTLGIKPNYDKVQAVWKSDSSNTLTPKQAFLSVHGEEIAKALESQKKLIETKAKSQSRLGSGEISQTKQTQGKEESFLEAAYRIANKLKE